MNLTANQKTAIIGTYGFIVNGNYNDAIKMLESALSEGNHGLIYAIKANIQTYYLRQPSEALKTIDEGISYNGIDYLLTAAKAANLSETSNNYDEIIALYRKSREYYPSSYLAYQNIFKELEEDDPVIAANLRSAFDIKAQDIDLRIVDFTRIADINRLYQQIQIIDEKMSNEKNRTLEIIGLFTAVLAFIFANVAKLPEISTAAQLLDFNLVLGGSLIVFALMISLIADRTKGLFVNWKFWAIISFIFLLFKK